MIKRGIVLRIIGIALLVMVSGLSIISPATATEPPGFIKKVPIKEQPTDPQVLQAITVAGVDKEYVELVKDYGLRSEGTTPYSRVYADKKSNLHFLEVSQLPMVDAQGDRLSPGWFLLGGKYYNNSADKVFNSLFIAEVDGLQVSLQVKDDQPDGIKAGEQVVYTPQLFIGGKEIKAPPEPTLLSVDPVNPNYQYNVLEWNYGIATRRMRIIEGIYQERWILNSNPYGVVEVRHNLLGNLPIELGTAWDAEGNLLKVTVIGDSEFVEASEFDNAVFPVEIGSTYYPEAGAGGGNTSVDGSVWETEDAGLTWANIIAAAGNAVDDTSLFNVCIGFRGDGNANEWDRMWRGIFNFDSSALPDACTITATTLTLYGHSKVDNLAVTPDINIYASNSAADNDLVGTDYATFSSTNFSSSVTYAGWNVSLVAAVANDFTFNASGIAAISKTGVTKLGTRNAQYEVANTPPGWAVQSSYMRAWNADKGVGYKPKLVVTFEDIPGATDNGANPSNPDLVYLEMRPQLDETRIKGQGQIPTQIWHGIFDGYSLPIWDSDNETLYFSICVPDRWDEETDIMVHIDSMLSNANEKGNNYRLELGWQYFTPEEDVVLTTNREFITTRAVLSSLQYQSYQDWFIIDYDDNIANPIVADDILALRLRRIDPPGAYNLDGELIVIHAGVLFSQGDLLGDPADVLTEASMEFFTLMFLPIGLTAILFGTRQVFLGFAAAIFWAIFGAYCFIQSEATWDINYMLGFASLMGMVAVCAFGAYAMKKNEKGMIEEAKDFDEGISEEEEESMELGSSRSDRVRERAKRRKNKNIVSRLARGGK